MRQRWGEREKNEEKEDGEGDGDGEEEEEEEEKKRERDWEHSLTTPPQHTPCSTFLDLTSEYEALREPESEISHTP